MVLIFSMIPFHNLTEWNLPISFSVNGICKLMIIIVEREQNICPSLGLKYKSVIFFLQFHYLLTFSLEHVHHHKKYCICNIYMYNIYSICNKRSIIIQSKKI